MALYSSSVEYGLHCLLFLADASGEAKATSQDLADMHGLSPTYIAKLFSRLKKAGLVRATEGAHGGYQLARPADRITVLDVVKALEGNKPMFQCRDVRKTCALFGDSPPTWATKGMCSIHAVMREAEHQMHQTLRKHTLADIAARLARKAPQTFMLEVQDWFGNRAKRRRSSKN